jgi:predicted  nucleic acid-binding Zn ribbon protein
MVTKREWGIMNCVREKFLLGDKTIVDTNRSHSEKMQTCLNCLLNNEIQYWIFALVDFKAHQCTVCANVSYSALCCACIMNLI